MTAEPLSDRTVLFVDDDDLMMELAPALLEALGCRDIILAAEREEAIAIIESDRHFDIAIVDVTLDREQTGFELAAMIVTLRPAVDVIQISGLHELTHRGLHEGVRSLQKPFGLHELRALFADPPDAQL